MPSEVTQWQILDAGQPDGVKRYFITQNGKPEQTLRKECDLLSYLTIR